MKKFDLTFLVVMLVVSLNAIYETFFAPYHIRFYANPLQNIIWMGIMTCIWVTLRNPEVNRTPKESRQ